MPTIETLLAFSLVCIMLSFTPGPSILYIMARSISQGPRAGVAAAGGMALGGFFYVIVTALGLAAVLRAMPVAIVVVKVVGAFYLVYLGLQHFKESHIAAPEEKSKAMAHGKIFRQSIIVELTNPKTALFFLAFLTQFVNPEQGSVGMQLAVLGVLNACITFCCDTIVAYTSGRIGVWLKQKPHMAVWQDRAAGSVMIFLGAFIGIELLQTE